ncbi:MAG: beta-galactosidase trimerization domain-containing protein, partial [Armatimonadota bacterium]
MLIHKLASLCFAFLLVALASCVQATDAGADQAARAAQAFRQGQPVQAASDGAYFCEAEEFTVQPGAQVWKAQPWGDGYYDGTTGGGGFHSRKAFLGAPAQCPQTAAAINVNIREAGHYLVLARYEGVSRYETRFTIKINQGGRTVFYRPYGQGRQWVGGRGRILWEGYQAWAELQPGLATITLIAGPQPEPAARRNVDVIMLTRDEAQVKARIAKATRPDVYLPLDGWLTQDGDVWLRVTNTGTEKAAVKSLSLYGWTFQQHSPYWVHQRNSKPVSIEVEPGKASAWTEVGSTMDALMDGQWGFTSSGLCTLEFGLKNAAGTIEPLRTFTNVNGRLDLVGLANVRYTRQLPTPAELSAGILAYLKGLQPSLHGKPPSHTLVLASGGWTKEDWQFLTDLYGFNGRYLPQPREAEYGMAYSTPAQIEEKCHKLSEEQRRNIAVVSLGDEIGLPVPTKEAATTGFIAFLQAQGLTPAQVDPAAGDDWSKVVYNTNAKLKEANPGVYYWSMRYLYAYGIQAIKAQTDMVRQYLPNAGVGANFSPYFPSEHAYLGETFKWVTCFRQDGMTQPWSEDWAFGLPIGTQQMNGISLDLLRAGIRGKADRKIHFYVMAHYPGNNPTSFRRMFYNALGHGAKVLNLFEVDPVWLAYTENHVNGTATYGEMLKSLYELGTFDDIVETGQVRPSQVGLWFSETGDIWGDAFNSGSAAKRALYIAILHQQVPLDFIVEQDALDGTLDQYRVLYLTDRHVSRAASVQIAAWVKGGGRLFATAGAGMYDEYHQPNTVLRELMGVAEKDFAAPPDAQVAFIKQDLPFVQPLQTVDLALPGQGRKQAPAFAAVSTVTAAADARVDGTFVNGLPAVVRRQAGTGETIYCGFLPGLSYFRPAIPRQPFDRNSRPDSLPHFVPTSFDANVSALIGAPLRDVVRPVTTSDPLVEASVVQSPAGTVIVLDNWRGKPINGLQVTINFPLPATSAALATGKPVRMIRRGAATTCT